MSKKILKTDFIEDIVVAENLGYVYLIQAPALKKLNTFKYGKTTDLLNRFRGYPRNSELYHLKRVNDCHYVEKEIKKTFAIHFTHEKKHGREYFSGNLKLMKLCIDKIIEKSNQQIDEKNLTEKIKNTYKNYLTVSIENNPDNDDSSDNNDTSDNDDTNYNTNDDDNTNTNNYFIEKNPSAKTTKHKCTQCNKNFTRKESLVYHINNNSCRTPKYFCKYCNAGFTSNSNMLRHVKTICKNKQNDENTKKEIKETNVVNVTLKTQIKELQNKVKALEKTFSDNVTSTEQTNNNINLVPYGSEDFTKLTKPELLKIFQNGSHSVVKLIEALHFNIKHPEYHNIYISNMKDIYAMVYDGKNWNLKRKNELIDKIYENIKNYMKENLKEFVDALSSSDNENLKKWLETNDEDKKIKNEIKLSLYNLREIPINTRNKTTLNYSNNVKVVKNCVRKVVSNRKIII